MVELPVGAGHPNVQIRRRARTHAGAWPRGENPAERAPAAPCGSDPGPLVELVVGATRESVKRAVGRVGAKGVLERVGGGPAGVEAARRERAAHSDRPGPRLIEVLEPPRAD